MASPSLTSEAITAKQQPIDPICTLRIQIEVPEFVLSTYERPMPTKPLIMSVISVEVFPHANNILTHTMRHLFRGDAPSQNRRRRSHS